MKYAVIGSRSFNDYELMRTVLDGFKINGIVSGGAKGADSLARQYAGEKDIEIREYLPEYNRYGKSAPLIRNRLIVDDSNVVIAFWNGKSRGTKHSIDYAKSIGKVVDVIRF